MVKVSKKMDKKNKLWTDVKINAGGKTLEFSINENGYILIFNYTSDMQINFTGGKNFVAKVSSVNELGHVKTIDFSLNTEV